MHLFGTDMDIAPQSTCTQTNTVGHTERPISQSSPMFTAFTCWQR